MIKLCLSRRKLFRYCNYLFHLFFLFSQPLYAASFTINDGQTVGAQTLDAADETGLVESGGTITKSTAFGTSVNITATATNASLTNNGSITATGSTTIAIVANIATGVSVTNNGTVFSEQGRAIRFLSSNGSITNNGTISTGTATGREAVLISNANNVTFTNNGTISTSRDNIAARALRIDSATNVTVTNTGTITSTGSNAILHGGTNLTIINSGTISSTDATDDAVSFLGNGGTITNTGTISATGAGAQSISFGTDTYTLNNSGTIIASGNATQAIDGGNGNLTLNLQSGSKIIGSIDLGGGTDTLNVSGDNSITGDIDMGAGTNAININSGILTLNGTVTNSDTNVNSGGTLKGNSTTANLNINGGTVAPGNSIGTINVTGNVDFSGGGIYEVEVDAAGNSDKIIATGTATLTGGQVTILPETGNYASNTTYTILTATGGVTGTLTSSSTFAFLVPTLSYDANNVFLNLAVSFNNIADLTANQTAVSNTLSSIHTTNRTSLQELFTNLLFLNETDAKLALDSLSGIQHTHGQLVINQLSQQFQQLLFNQSGSGLTNAVALNAFSSFDPMQGTLLADNSDNWQTMATDSSNLFTNSRGWWFQGLGGFGSIDATSNASGVDYQSGGFAFGLDTDWRDFVVGFAGSYAHTNVDPFAGDSDIDSVQAGAYSSWERDDQYINASLSLGYHMADASRTVTVGTSVNTASADYDTYNISTAIETGKAFKLNLSTTLTPYAGFTYRYNHRDSFTETGAGTANLSVRSEDENSLRSQLGVRLSHELNTDDDRHITPYIDVAYVREYLDSVSRLEAGFTAVSTSTFQIDGVDLDRDRLRLGVGVSGQLNESTTLNLAYTGELADSDDHHAFIATANFVW